MSDTQQAAEVVTEVIADQAAEIVAENNATTAQAESVQAALVAAQLEDMHARRLSEIENGANVRFAEMHQRLSTCETMQAETLSKLTTMETTLGMIALSTPQPSPSPGAALVDRPEPVAAQVVVVAEPPRNASESTESAEKHPAERQAQKKRRHLV